MKAVLIAPTAHIGEFEGPVEGSIGMALMGQTIDPEYTAAYKRLAELGQYVILDNGVYEKVSYTFHEVFAMATAMGASEIVMPDDMNQMFQTTIAVRDGLVAYNQHLSRGGDIIRPMYVPHGENPSLYYTCVVQILQLHDMFMPGVPFTLGVSRCYEAFPGGRYRIIENTYDKLRHLRGDFEVHLLGWGRDLADVPFIAEDFPWVRSVDTAKPFNWAMIYEDLQQLSPLQREPRREIEYFDRTLNSSQRAVAWRNVGAFMLACKGTQLEARAGVKPATRRSQAEPA